MTILRKCKRCEEWKDVDLFVITHYSQLGPIHGTICRQCDKTPKKRSE